MAKINLKLLKLSDLKVIPTQEKPVYVFVKANAETTGDRQGADGTFLNHPNSGFANLIRKFTINNETN